jgi:hypothetical protein
VVEWWSGGVVEWWSGGVAEWRSGGVAEWRSGGVAEWRSGGGRSMAFINDCQRSPLPIPFQPLSLISERLHYHYH